jgi:hypothetical protein
MYSLYIPPILPLYVWLLHATYFWSSPLRVCGVCVCARARVVVEYGARRLPCAYARMRAIFIFMLPLVSLVLVLCLSSSFFRFSLFFSHSSLFIAVRFVACRVSCALVWRPCAV